MAFPVSESPSSGRSERFLRSVLWNWLSVAVTLGTGFFLSPYMIRKIGDDNFGLWSLILSFIEYYWLLDLGFRSAIIKYSAHYCATGDLEKVNELVNTALLYSTCAGMLLLSLTALLAPGIGRFFHILNPVFPKLILVAGAAWVLGVVFNVYGAVLEGFQRFDLTNRIQISTSALRSLALFLALAGGYGLVEMTWLLLLGHLSVYVLSWAAYRKVYPQARFSPRFARISMFREILGYGIHTFVITISQRVLAQSVPLLIGYFLPVRYVGYYAVPTRLLDYAADAISRVGLVTAPNAADLIAKGDRAALAELGVYSNRYCVTLYLPLAIFLLVYAQPFLLLWLKKPEFAAASAPLVAPLLLGMTFATAGQFNSISILFGMAKHDKYAKALFIEALSNIAGLLFVLPRYGLLGGVWVLTVFCLLNRFLLASWLFSRELQISWLGYLTKIYASPLAVSTPLVALLFWLRSTSLPGQTWVQLGAAAAILFSLYAALALLFCVRADHRALVLRLGTRWMRSH